MDMPHVRATVRRITIFDRDSTGSLRPVVIYNRRRSKKKQTKGLKPFEQVVRSIAEGRWRVLGDTDGNGAADFAIDVYAAAAPTTLDFVL